MTFVTFDLHSLSKIIQRLITPYVYIVSLRHLVKSTRQQCFLRSTR